MDPKAYKNWSRCEPDESAANVAQVLKSAETQASWRHYMAAKGAAIYESVNRGSVFQGQQYYDCASTVGGKAGAKGDRNGIAWKFGQRLTNTIVAKVMGLDNPKCQMVTTDANWEDKVDAIWADRFIEGNGHEQQGNFSNLWDLGRAGATMALAATGMAGIRTEPDFVFKRVSHTLRSTLSTFIDPGDLHHGRPLSYFDVTWENPEVLAEDPRWTKHKDWIMAHAEPMPIWMRQEGELNMQTPMVRVVTAWRMPFGSFKGREARFVGGKAIQWDDYPHSTPRISFFRASRVLGDSFFGVSLLSAVYEPLAIANKVVKRTHEALDQLSDTHLAVDTSQISEKSMGSAKNVKITKFDGEKGQGRPPVHVITQPIVDQTRMQFADRNIQVAHEILGTDQMHTAGRSNPGVDSGRAIRMEASLFSENHSVLQREWRNWIAIGVGGNTVNAAAEIGEHEPDWQQHWEGEDFATKISVERILRIDKNKYAMRAYVVAEQKNTPSDRAAMANEMLANGQLSPEAHAEIVNETFDTPSETKQESNQRRFFAKMIDLAFHADQSDVDDPDFWATKYQNPPPWVNAPMGMRQVFGAYWEALIDDIPQYRREVLKRILEELDFMVQQAAQSAAAAEGLRVSVEAGSVGEAMGEAPLPGPGDPNDPTAATGAPPGVIPI